MEASTTSASSKTARYTNVKLKLSDNQKSKIKKALSDGAPVNIRISVENLSGEDLVALTNSQISRINKAVQAGKGVTIKMSKTQVMYNMKIEGGFLPLLAGLASSILPVLTGTVLPALATGALSGLAGTAVNKIVDNISGKGHPCTACITRQSRSGMASQCKGSSVYIKRGSGCFKVDEQGSGLFIKPYSGVKMNTLGDGLYLKSGSGFIDGSGLILGDSSPFRNIPILGWLL